MGDDRFCYLHVPYNLASHLIDEEDEKLGWDLPDDDIQVPLHLLPAYQDEDDETVLPSASHPSYPYGNPYTHRLPLSSSSSSSSHSNTGRLPPTATASSSSSRDQTRTQAQSLSSSLPILELRQLYAHTNLGDGRERTWPELGLDQVVGNGNGTGGGGSLAHFVATNGSNAVGGHTAGGSGGVDAGVPAGQNAADGTPGEEELISEDDEGVGGGGEDRGRRRDDGME